MQTQRQTSSALTRPKLISEIAREVVRLAADSEGLERWLTVHGGSSTSPSLATRAMARSLYGDSEDGLMFNVALVLAVDRTVSN
jgi:hypothetical protein